MAALTLCSASAASHCLGALIGPVPYTSQADVPANFYQVDAAVILEDFEDGTLDFGITVSGGSIAGPGGNTDSVDIDDGTLDGSGTNGRSWFVAGVSNTASLTFTFSGPLPIAAGIVWTDGAPTHDITFEAFGPGMTSLGQLGPFNFADAVTNGTTSEDRFFGATDAGGILVVRITNSGAAGGLEVDHVQYALAVPETETAGLALAGLAFFYCQRRRRPSG